ncbi:hypothetical protein [Sphingopyxis macrogoltabida]|uniref:Uncharacterized protein n=1 Tax=Sphingopyxis macrogoltabida TaxID=33050 RepID=A0AAC8Z0X8_SPHMC|nr:hypothetical protein [Sphingopyxis macrogoltabida]ALJ12589.1 hypothetical protein LH19_06895 [Sphingopyxis macrogoltabida]AMU89940.1 hypothetical protein ATM17_12925 [Sphingopyxis macrogoltabida]
MFMLKSTHEAAHASLKERLATAETERDDFEAKFKKAITDLAAAQDDVAGYESALGFSLSGPCPICGGIEGCSHSRSERIRGAIAQTGMVAGLERAIASLKPDALAHRARLKRDREQKAAKRAAKAPVKGAGK